MLHPQRTIFLVSCVSKKRDAPSRAKDLYISEWFLKARAYVESTESPWFILSAEHGLVSPDQVLAPYERTLNTMSISARNTWATKVKAQMETSLPIADRIVVLAGQRYREFLMDYLRQRVGTVANSLPALRFPFSNSAIPLNGIYILFERGEIAHATNRIVRVGTHTGNKQLCSRLRQHFLVENKDRSIFRKNVGRALLNRDHDPFLPSWELDRTTRLTREKNLVDLDRQKTIESAVSNYIRENFTFVAVRVDDKGQRLHLESRIISTVSLCHACRPSTGWLGSFSPKDKICASGLWLVNELYKQPLSTEEFEALRRKSIQSNDA